MPQLLTARGKGKNRKVSALGADNQPVGELISTDSESIIEAGHERKPELPLLAPMQDLDFISTETPVSGAKAKLIVRFPRQREASLPITGKRFL